MTALVLRGTDRFSTYSLRRARAGSAADRIPVLRIPVARRVPAWDFVSQIRRYKARKRTLMYSSEA
jgi:hypothetical protein